MEKIKNLLSKINWTDKRLIAIVLVVLLILLMMGFNNRLVNMNRLIAPDEQLSTPVPTPVAEEEIKLSNFETWKLLLFGED